MWCFLPTTDISCIGQPFFFFLSNQNMALAMKSKNRKTLLIVLAWNGFKVKYTWKGEQKTKNNKVFVVVVNEGNSCQFTVDSQLLTSLDWGAIYAAALHVIRRKRTLLSEAAVWVDLTGRSAGEQMKMCVMCLCEYTEWIKKYMRGKFVSTDTV